MTFGKNPYKEKSKSHYQYLDKFIEEIPSLPIQVCGIRVGLRIRRKYKIYYN